MFYLLNLIQCSCEEISRKPFGICPDQLIFPHPHAINCVIETVTKELISKLKELDCRVCLHLDCMTCIWPIVALFGTKVNPSLPLLLRDKPCQQNVFDCTSVVDQRAKLLQRFLPQQVMPRGSKNSEAVSPKCCHSDGNRGIWVEKLKCYKSHFPFCIIHGTGGKQDFLSGKTKISLEGGYWHRPILT